MARVSPPPTVEFVDDDAVTGVAERELLAERGGTFLSETEVGFADLPQQTWWWFSQSLCWQKAPQYRAILQPLQVSLAFLPQFQQLCK
jgi:hypothetical protein